MTHEPLTQRQSQIVEVAIELISTMGIQHLTMKRIAERLDVSEPAIYRHFKSKIDILLTILADFRAQRQAIVEQVMVTDAPATKKLQAMFGGIIERLVEQPTVAAVLFAEEIFQDDTQLAAAVSEMMQGNQKVLLKIIRAGQASGEIRNDISAEQLMIVTMGAFRLTVVRWRMASHSFDLKRAGNALAQTMQKILASDNNTGAAP